MGFAKMQIPVNRYTVGLVFAVLVFFGQDFVEPLMRTIAILTSPHVPAI